MDQNFLNVITDFSAIEVRGVQSSEFLQGQFTCDIRNLSSGQAIPGACCDHKGRMVFNGWLGRGGPENFIVFLPANMLQTAVAHLQKYAVFSKVTLRENSSWKALCYYGKAADLNGNFLIQGHLPCPNPHGFNFYWLIGSQESLNFIQEKLQKNIPLIKESDLRLRLIDLKVVFVQPPTQSLFIPQMIGLEKLGGVSFSKGCYTGQEVVARTQHLGQLKRHLQILQLTAKDAPKIGEPLINSQKEVVGHIASIAECREQTYRLLAVLQDRALEHPIFHGQCLDL